jgi:murein DD-endopeptidase MepM/ murein hydrolase activator NlpD
MAKTTGRRRRKWLKKLKNRFRLTILNENTFEEQFSYSLTPLNVIIMFGGLLLLFGALIYLLVAFTPLKAYVIPDFTDYAYREDARNARLTADSLQTVVEQNEKFLSNLKIILNGGTIDAQDTANRQIAVGDLNYRVSEMDSGLRRKLTNQDRYQLTVEEDRKASEKGFLLFNPVNGSLSGEFDPKTGHFGIDLVAPREDPVKAVLDGTVIFASFTSDGGNVIEIQHRNNLISVYKHNSSLLKQLGEQVKAGESIAFIGDSGENSNGPHLHFELWSAGIPVNPLDYLPLNR